MGNRVERFEDLIAWQKARVLSKEIRGLARKARLSRDYAACDQLRRAARSVMANLAEGFDRGSRAEFHQFIVISKGSCAELRSDLYTLLDDGLIDQRTFDRLYALCDEESRILAGLRNAVARQRGR